VLGEEFAVGARLRPGGLHEEPVRLRHGARLDASRAAEQSSPQHRLVNRSSLNPSHGAKSPIEPPSDAVASGGQRHAQSAGAPLVSTDMPARE
jgi:hypothetical protein